MPSLKEKKSVYLPVTSETTQNLRVKQVISLSSKSSGEES